MTLDEFLASSARRNAWIKYEDADVYLRKANRLLNRAPFVPTPLVPTIDISSIVCETPRKGTFTRLVAELQAKTNSALFLENTYREFAEACFRHGWTMHTVLTDEDAGIYCLYLVVPPKLSPDPSPEPVS